MNIAALKTNIMSGAYDSDFSMLYGNVQAARARYSNACDSFESLFPGRDNLRLFSAPGRTEVGGNHTDHQHGSVLAGGVDMDVIAIVSENTDGIIRIKSEGFTQDTVDVSDTAIRESETGKAISLIRGVCGGFAEMGCTLGGFDAYTTSNVLKGSGLSSSAAFEVLVANIVNSLFGGGKFDPITLAKIGQRAEREYFGKPCGLLDQMASSSGGFIFADFHDPANPVSEKIDIDINKLGYTLCVVDTGGNHADLTQDYADITLECKSVSKALGVEFLRDADQDIFYRDMAKLRKTCGDRAVLRAFHFFHEQARVDSQTAALKAGDFEGFLKLVNASGESSCQYLQNLYSVSAVSEQGLPLAIALTKRFLNGRGACRVHGGGFAGTIQCYIPNDRLSDYKSMIENVFGAGSCAVLSIRPVGGYEINTYSK